MRGGAHKPPVIPGRRRKVASPESMALGQWLWIPGSRKSAPRNDTAYDSKFEIALLDVAVETSRRRRCPQPPSPPEPPAMRANTRTGALAGSFPVPHGLPRYPVGSASASLLSRPAQALHVTAHWLAQSPSGDLCRRAPARSVPRSDRPVSYSINRLTIEMESSSIGNTRLTGRTEQNRLPLTAKSARNVRRLCPRC